MGLKGYRLWAMGQLDSTCKAPPRPTRTRCARPAAPARLPCSPAHPRASRATRWGSAASRAAPGRAAAGGRCVVVQVEFESKPVQGLKPGAFKLCVN
jgi:hypothetical protein